MNIEYLNFRGFNVTSNEKYTVEEDGKGGITQVGDSYQGLENVRTLTVNKSDVMSIYSYIPEIVDLNDGECAACYGCLSYRVVLGLKNQGYLELNIVSDVPVNNMTSDGISLFTDTTDSGYRALTVPFNSFALNSTVAGFNCSGNVNPRISTLNNVDLINGIQYQWTPEAIRAYFGVFNSNTSDATSVYELVSRWLEEKVSEYLIANPGAPITDVVLGEVKDFTYDDGTGPVTYGGFKLRFGGIGIPAPDVGADSVVLFDKVQNPTYPFRWSDIHAIETSAGGGGESEA